mmetsp:Transcript_20966/g.31062  ORF Transcript_20966/g.31062 Transcript_20966/m.31062 type:complete len:106 (-) Transcript_20966:1593-1910(-)
MLDVPKYAVAMSENIENSLSVVSDVTMAICQMQQLPGDEIGDGVTIEVDYDGVKDTIIGREGDIQSIDVVEVPTPPPSPPTVSSRKKSSSKIRNALRMNKKKHVF